MNALLTAVLLILAQAAEPNPCTNGSFEALNANGAPVDWNILNQGGVIDTDAHTGERCLRLARSPEDPHPETGLNRLWAPRGGEGGAMLGRVKGGMEFWYKALSASNRNIHFFVIPMDASPFETKGQRADFVVPENHVGDGQWHCGRLKYDYTDVPEVKWVHFAARIFGGAGEVLVDDMAYVEEVGPWLTIKHLRIEESPESPGEVCTLSARIENEGDRLAQRAILTLETPSKVQATPRSTTLEGLAPGAHATFSWEVTGRRTEAGELLLRVHTPGREVVTQKAYAPALVVRSFGPVRPLVRAGDEVVFECVLENRGGAFVSAPEARFWLGEKEQVAWSSDIPPGGMATLSTAGTAGAYAEEAVARMSLISESIEAPVEMLARAVVVPAVDVPEPSGSLGTVANERWIVLENNRIRLIFIALYEGGFGPAFLSANVDGTWRELGALPVLGTLAYGPGAPSVQEIRPATAAGGTQGSEARLSFAWSHRDATGALWTGTMEFILEEDDNTIAAEYTLACDRDRGLLRFDGPMLYALEREEGLLPGAEWLIDEEVSSSTLDIEEGHPHQRRYVPHPNMITIPAMGVYAEGAAVGLLWDPRAPWDGMRDRPAPVFASPDRFNNQRAHLMGLQLPSVPEFLDANTRMAKAPYPLKANQPLRLRCRLFATPAHDALASMDAWFGRHGFPEPSPLPHGTYEEEIAFSMRAYLESLWDPETQEWWSTKNGHPIMAYKTRPPAYVADLLLGALLSPDPTLRAQCRARAEEMAVLMGYEPRIDVLRFNRRGDFNLLSPGYIANLLAGRAPDGLWRFDADHEDDGVFKGLDYHTLGPDNADALGTSSSHAHRVMRYVRASGDWAAYEQVVPVLEKMAAYRVPRAAQVWEVPFHSPDILAAAQAVDTFVDAYRFTGEGRWLEAAVAWARKGLPFLYFWEEPGRPYMLGASIPVYGATLFRHSWFGRPVQWNGLVYANVLLKLDEFDQSYPWRKIATSVIHSAVHQQAADGEDAALWPDSISAIDGEKSAWVFSPRQILDGITRLLGRSEEPHTILLGEGRHRIHITAVGEIEEVTLGESGVHFTITFPDGEQGTIVLANLSRPAAVLLDGVPAPEKPEARTGPRWEYDEARAALIVGIPKDGTTAVQAEGARLRYIERMPQPIASLDFRFDASTEGWMPTHNVENLRAVEGHLLGDITGGDPYLARSAVTVSGDTYAAVEVRMRVSGGGHAQFYWSTSDAPSIDEAKVVVFPIQADGEFHTYRLDTAGHPYWAGQHITGIRLDPTNSVADGGFAIDYVRGIASTP